MKKFIIGCLFFNSVIFAMEDKKSCTLVEEALLRAHIKLRFRYDNNFPKQTAQVIVQGDIPVTFTHEKANACACCHIFLKDKPSTGNMISVTPSHQGQQGSVVVQLERADYTEIKEEIENKKMDNRYKMIESILNFYDLN